MLESLRPRRHSSMESACHCPPRAASLSKRRIHISARWRMSGKGLQDRPGKPDPIASHRAFKSSPLRHGRARQHHRPGVLRTRSRRACAVDCLSHAQRPGRQKKPKTKCQGKVPRRLRPLLRARQSPDRPPRTPRANLLPQSPRKRWRRSRGSSLVPRLCPHWHHLSPSRRPSPP